MTTAEQAFKNLHMMAKACYFDVPYESRQDMQKFDMELLPYTSNTYRPNVYRWAESEFRKLHHNYKIQDILLDDNPLVRGIIVRVYARPCTHEEIYRDQLDYFLYDCL